MTSEEDKLIAGVFALGLKKGFIDREAVVGWADGVIAERAAPEEGLIDLSLAALLDMQNSISRLRQIAGNVDDHVVFCTVLALLRFPRELSFEDAERMAAGLSQAADECDTTSRPWELLYSMYAVAEQFVCIRNDYYPGTKAQAIGDLLALVKRWQASAVPAALRGVQVSFRKVTS